MEKTVVVDQGGLGNFKTIQEAINSIPDQNTQWIEINVKSGVYRSIACLIKRIITFFLNYAPFCFPNSFLNTIPIK